MSDDLKYMYEELPNVDVRDVVTQQGTQDFIGMSGVTHVKTWGTTVGASD